VWHDFRRNALAAMLVPALIGTVRAQPPDREADDGASRPRDPMWTLASGTRVTLFPSGDLFPAYVADPQRPANAMLVRVQQRRGIPDTSVRRTALSAGGRFGFLRIDGRGPNRRSWQVSFEAGIDALFGTTHSDEALGWDGNYGITATTASDGPWSVKLAFLHLSAHLGDEYEERMQRARIDYTREEVAVGIAWRPSSRWRAYAETARAYSMLDAAQAPWRVQHGLEYETGRFWGGRFAAYGATDCGAMQERRWRIDRAIEGGLVTRLAGRTYRLLMQYHDGRPPVAEFFHVSESALTWGLRIDP